MTNWTEKEVAALQKRNAMPMVLNTLDITLARDMPRDQAYAARSERKSKNKFGAHKVEVDGLKFDSKAEYRRWCQLQILLRTGAITELKRQVPYPLVPPQKSPDGTALRAVTYIADFTYLDSAGNLVVEDPKGVSTPVWEIKKKLMLMVHGIWVKEIRS